MGTVQKALHDFTTQVKFEDMDVCARIWLEPRSQQKVSQTFRYHWLLMLPMLINTYAGEIWSKSLSRPWSRARGSVNARRKSPQVPPIFNTPTLADVVCLTFFSLSSASSKLKIDFNWIMARFSSVFHATLGFTESLAYANPRKRSQGLNPCQNVIYISWSYRSFRIQYGVCRVIGL